MRVPDISELNAVFGEEPVSVAEVSLGQYMALEEWPEGEARWISRSAGSVTAVIINPSANRVSIDIQSPDLAVSLVLSNVVSLDTADRHGIKELAVDFDNHAGLGSLHLRLGPSVSLHWETATSGD